MLPFSAKSCQFVVHLCDGTLLPSRDVCTEAFPRNLRASFVVAIAFSGVSSPFSPSSNRLVSGPTASSVVACSFARDQLVLIILGEDGLLPSCPTSGLGLGPIEGRQTWPSTASELFPVSDDTEKLLKKEAFTKVSSNATWRC